MNKLFKRISLIVALLVTCGSVWSLEITNVRTQTNQIWVTFDQSLSSVSCGNVSDWSYLNVSGNTHDITSIVTIQNDNILYLHTGTESTAKNSTYEISCSSSCFRFTVTASDYTEDHNCTSCASSCVPVPSVSIASSTQTNSSITVTATVENFSETPSYVWEYKTGAGEYQTWPGTSATETITGLSSGTTYNIKVTAANPYDSEEATANHDFSTMSSQSCIVLANNTNYNAAQLHVFVSSGITSPYDDGNISYYTLDYVKVDGGSGTAVTQVGATSTEGSTNVYFALEGEPVSGSEMTLTYIKETESIHENSCVKFVMTDKALTSQECCSSSDPEVTLTCGTPTSTTVPLSWATSVEPANIKNITITIDEGHPIVLTQVSGRWPTTYTVAGLSKGTTHNFVIDVYYDDGGSVPLTDNCSATTLNTSECVFTSSDKEAKDGSWKDKCDFPGEYILDIKTTSTNPLTVNVKYTKPVGIVNPNVMLAAKHYTGDPSITEIGQMTNNGDDTYSLDIPTETLSNMRINTVGDSILIGVKNAVSDCTPGNMYCTKFVGYALGIGCNEPFILTFTKRTEDQSIFAIDTNVNIIRFAVRKLGSTDDYTYYTLDSETSSYTLNIKDFDVDTYEFVIYDKNGITSGVKVLHTVY